MKKKSIILLVCASAVFAATAQENSQWRGKARNGVYEETGLLKAWPPQGPALRWSYDGLGEGHTSVSAANDRIYVTGMTDSIGYLYVFDLRGTLLHRKSYGTEWNENYNGSRSTVHVHDGRLYIFSGRGVLVCLDEKTLDAVWEKNLLTDFDGNKLKFGITESPLIAGDLIYATPGGETHNVIALDKKTGEHVWSSPGIGKPSTYCSPQFVGGLDVPLVVNAIDSSLVAFHAVSGECLWAVDQKNPYGMNPNTPLVEGDRLFSTTGGGVGSMLLRIAGDGRSVEKLWTHEMDSKMGGAVKLGDYVYGSGEKNRYWYCIDWNTGETRYKSNRIGTGNVIAADGMLYCYSDRGEMALVEATPEGFKPAGQFKITLGTDQHWAHPVIYKGVLYVRHGNTLMAYQIR
jgi:outer membrane protein assembly factor BamB